MQIKPVAASPIWSRAMPTGPDTRVRLTEAYVRLVGCDFVQQYLRHLG